MTNRAGIAVLAIVALFGVFPIGYAPAMGGEAAKPVYVEIQSDGRTCVIAGTSVKCNGVLQHLRESMKLPPGSEVRFKADRAAPYLVVKAVMDAVLESEYITARAYLKEPSDG